MQKQLLQVHLMQRLKKGTTTETWESTKKCFVLEGLTNDYNNMDMELKSLFFNLRRKPTVENLNLTLSNNEFQNFLRKILNNFDGTESKMTVCFLRDVSTLLAMVSTVRQKNLEQHLQAEREMIKYCLLSTMSIIHCI